MHVNASKSPFHRDEAYSSKVAFFNKLAKDGDIPPTRPRGAPLPEWEALDEQKQYKLIKKSI